MKATAENKWLVIVNPNAGRRKGEKDWNQIAKLLEDEGFDFEHVMTCERFHAIEIAKEAIERGYKQIIVVGGDGTLNEVVNGIFQQKKYITTDIAIGMITVGTGNDWGRMYQVPFDYDKAVKTICKGRKVIQDAGKVNYHIDGKEESRYFANMAGMGYDALVAQKTNAMKEKGRGGPMAYFYNLLTGLYQYKSTYLEIEVDGECVFENDIFSMSLGICKYNGGGMMQLPHAVPDDGIFDITVVEKISKFRVLRNIKNLYDGSFEHLKEVKMFRGKSVNIVSRPKNSIFLETDGESLGHSPLRFSIVPKSICLIAGKKYFREK
ncbi:MAG: diacylglycerol kinase family lipid kinase [Bacteroidales bacterium]|nr:diacylglycerol kinase family lipid kinase [Bacteroidales bacterium]MCF8343893.1 diacylglycerol kinase family lipid kinase [Bacteroidales bacterium]MCF8352359.1 diacylglycerol kinase family lipid kinase [Bacteroidales bacterium]MCF8377481.1 diacylglycerol kinase family lipid kinase [Bacteroidales bacterium]MCF8401604.1 diacylglycerol kinase family lipid kinase [Bacteroidales bacterium]